MQLILNRQTPVGYPEGQSYLDADTIAGRGTMGFTDALVELDELERAIYKTLNNIECLEMNIQEIKYLVSSHTGLEQKVKYMQLVEGKSLRIAREITRELEIWIIVMDILKILI